MSPTHQSIYNGFLKLPVIGLAFFLFTSESSGAKCLKNLDYQKAEKTLALEVPVQSYEMKEFLRLIGKNISGTTEIYLLEFENGLMGVFKPDPKQAIPEVFAYELSKVLKLPVVPPTVFRKFKGKEGSVQLFIESSLDLQTEKDRTKARKIENPESLAKIKLFQFLSSKWDNHWGNVLMDTCGDWVSIDNDSVGDRAFWKYGEFPFRAFTNGVLKDLSKMKLENWREPFPFERVSSLKSPPLQSLRKIFSDYIFSDESLRKLHEMANSEFNGKSLNYVIWNNRVWVQSIKGFGIPYTEDYTLEMVESLRKLNISDVEAAYPKSSASGQGLKKWWLVAFKKRLDAVLKHTNSLGL